MSCDTCKKDKAIILRSKNKTKVCKSCFFNHFEEDIHDTIISSKMFKEDMTVGIGISGGKDSTVLAFVLEKLNKQYNYKLKLVLLCVDEGIEGYRDFSINTVLENAKDLKLNLKIVSFDDMFKINMDSIVKNVGTKSNCTYCGIFRRQALEEAARKFKVDIIVTGHNADDMAETVLLNLIRGDYNRLIRCTQPVTNKQLINNDFCLSLPRAKPFKYTYQKEIVLYAFHKKLNYFSTECTYAPESSRGYVRNFLKELEKIDSSIILKIIKCGDMFQNTKENAFNVFKCINCSHPTSSKNKICKGCSLIELLK
ncbi:adenine nucleotide alpha hydrolase [Vairimorpha apis BRL 01]|uniref:Adenine nucleotide alpha hydrolase n=1 Tax=Vairimorpha apis BRL 01 TaxID=1037528 RepID=T0L1H7_9MICR|nr:adenine nucleotide alpha hydrolase [Vairimorpha apis BRL 01]